MELNIENQQESLEVDSELRQKLMEGLIMLLLEEGLEPSVEIDLLLVEPEVMQEINRIHRKVDKVTDVLSFPLLEFSKGSLETHEVDKNPENGLLSLGEIIICTQKAVDQAQAYGHSVLREIVFLFIHALLHLLGYDHVTKEDEEEMIKKQEDILHKLGLPREV